ncbi:carboxymuconolactone decarboxylase family protein [Sporolactobacillus putidus]|uniref:4-carboxymuconolactone decarboxylase n=1 Tax=Sporolactobacillus putidus TaxID=492735 RepID=A0A917S1W5_9BACL|nr:carboxymuconolactone decarboxylase family protein [Sporolactobacillus putidus]GGL51494.1 4-carboxymuconolactone decarboxylase [Sporolactobacillus putidus]
MEKTRYEIGLEKLAEVDGRQGDRVIQSLKELAPDLGKFIIEFAFGDIYTRPALDLKQRECVTLSSLAVLGGTENQLRVHINGALNVGVTPEEVIEVFIQCIPYVGFPRVLNAVSVAKEVFKSRKIIQ